MNTSASRKLGLATRLNTFQKDQISGYAFIAPMLIGYILFGLVPIISTFGISLTNWSLIRSPSFVGWRNYIRLFEDPTFLVVVRNTLYFTVLLVPSNLLLCLGVASMLKSQFFGVGFFRTAVFAPVVTSAVVWSIIWKYILQTDNGIANVLLRYLGIQGPQWLYNTSLAIPVVVFVTLVKDFGMNTVILIGAMQEVPQMYYEAAELDGASKHRQFRSVTLPLIAPSIFLTTILTIIGSFKVFAQIYTLSGGGPGTSSYVFVYYIYQQAFKFYRLGYASTISVILFILILALTILQWKLRKKWIYYEE